MNKQITVISGALVHDGKLLMSLRNEEGNVLQHI